MVVKQQLADQLKAQSEIWRAQVKDYQERLEQMGEQGSQRVQEDDGADASEGRGSTQTCRAGSRRQRGRVERHGHSKPESFCRTSTGLGRCRVALQVIETSELGWIWPNVQPVDNRHAWLRRSLEGTRHHEDQSCRPATRWAPNCPMRNRSRSPSRRSSSTDPVVAKCWSRSVRRVSAIPTFQ